MSIQGEIERINSTVAEQVELIQEITDILDTKASGGGSSNTVFQINRIRFVPYGPSGYEKPKINLIVNDKEIFETMVGFGDYDTNFLFDISDNKVFLKVSSTLYIYRCLINENTLFINAHSIDPTKITEIYFGGFTDNFGDGNYTISQMDCFIYMGNEDVIEIYDLYNYVDIPFTDFEPFYGNPKTLPITAIYGAIIDDDISYSWIGSQCYVEDNKMYVKVCMWV